ncbi:MAG: tetratricopeptide repeat protein [Nitrospirae bacterium]|nr:tetratricopeptide repeat protein [Nitrospirota bacterium]
MAACLLLASCQTAGHPRPDESAATGTKAGVRQETRIGMGKVGHLDPPYPWQAYYHEVQADIALTLGNPFLALDEVRKALAYKPRSVYLGLLEARVLAKTGNLSAATKAAEDLAHAHPNRLKPWLLLGTLLQLEALKETDPSIQKSFLKKIVPVYRDHVLELDPLKDEAYIALSDIYSKLGDNQKSMAVLEEGVKKSSRSAYLPFYLGFRYERAGDDSKAISLYKLSLSRNPRFAPALESLGDIYSRKGEWENARENYERLLSLQEVGRIDLEVKLLKTYFSLEKYPEAVLLLKRAIGEHPQNSRLPLILSSLLVQESRYDEAIRQIEEILRSHPEDPRLLSFLGSVYEKSLHFTRAIATYRLMIRRFPNLYEGAYDLGDLYRRLDNSPKALLYLKDAKSLSPERWEISFSIALAYMDQKKFPEALKALERAERLSARNPILIFNKAILYDQWDHKRYLPRVVALLKKTLAIDKGFADALNYLGYTEVIEHGDLVKARYMILHALTLDPKNGAYRDSLGWLYDRQGHFLKAIREETRALTSMPHDPTVLDHEGRIEHHLAMDIENHSLSSDRKTLLLSFLLPKGASPPSGSLPDYLLSRSKAHMRESIMIHPLRHKRVLRYLAWYLREDPAFIADLRKAVRLWVTLHPPSGPLRLYRVESGDTLQSIAAKASVYGSPRYWRLLEKANRAIVKNPNDLPWGAILTIPHFSPSQRTVRKSPRGASTLPSGEILFPGLTRNIHPYDTDAA